MDKIVSKSYSDRGREEHERIFGKPGERKNKLLIPGDGKQGTFEVKA
jgi:hypothetical protein